MEKNSENDIEEATSEPGVNHEEAKRTCRVELSKNQ